MSNICNDLRAAILQSAMEGSLTKTDIELWTTKPLIDLCDIRTGDSISENAKKAKYAGIKDGLSYIGTKDLNFDHSFNYNNGVRIPTGENGFKTAKIGDILLCIEGGSAGRKIGILEEEVCYGNKLCKFSTTDGLYNRFLYYFIQSSKFQNQFMDRKTGIIGGVSIKNVKKINISYPTIDEQKHIVKKIDGIMSRIATLEQSVESLSSLKKKFPDDIKASILQSAIQGLLTKQLPSDNNSRLLLEQIKLEKRKLVEEGIIKKQKTLPPIKEDEKPFPIPKDWEWVRLRDITLDDISYGIIKLGAEDKNGVKVLRCSDVKKGYINTSTVRTVSKALSEQYSRTLLRGGEIVINVRGTLGGCSIVPDELNGYNVAREVAVIRQSSLIYNKYLMSVLLSNYFNEYMFNGLRGIAYKGLNMNTLSLLPIPLPPLAEQKRIVERLDSLMQNINTVEELILSE